MNLNRQQRSQIEDPHLHTWQSSPVLALKTILSLPPSGLIFFPLSLLICGELSNFFLLWVVTRVKLFLII